MTKMVELKLKHLLLPTLQGYIKWMLEGEKACETEKADRIRCIEEILRKVEEIEKLIK